MKKLSTLIVHLNIYLTISLVTMFHTTHTDFLDDYINNEPHFVDIFDDTTNDESNAFDEFLTTALSLRKLDIEDLLGFLEELGALKILQQDFFLNTNPLVKRNILDSPLFERITCKQPYTWDVGVTTFFNKTNKYNFTRNSNCIASYLALASPTLIDAIEQTIDQAKKLAEFNDINVRKILTIAQKMNLEDRTAGFMVHAIRQWNNVQLKMLLPLIYHERNFFLTDNELIDLSNELGQSNDDDEFKEEHAISDRFGIGDMRLEMAFNIYDKSALCATAGIFTTLPTAFSIVKGIYGSTFEKPSTYPSIDFDRLLDILNKQLCEEPISFHEQQEINTILSDFIIGALDRLSANLLDDTLGNHGHVGLGGFFCADAPLSHLTDRTWAQQTFWHNRASLEYFFPKEEKRFFINKNDPDSFNNKNFSNADQANDNLAFLEDEIINRIYLLALKTNILPGLVFNWTSKLVHQNDCWGFQCGSNLYVQSREHFGTICADKALVSTLDIKKAQPSFGCQWKLFGGIWGIIEEGERTWRVGIDADVTALKASLGRDYTIGLRIDALF